MRNLLLILLISIAFVSCVDNFDEFVLDEIITDEFDEVEMLRLINQTRTTGYILDTDTNKLIISDLNKLSWDSTLYVAAQIQSVYMNQLDDHNHIWRDGTDLRKRLLIVNCNYRPVGENILYNSCNTDEAIIFNMWLNSDTHRNNILNNKFNVVAVSKKGIYWTMVLGYKPPK